MAYISSSTATAATTPAATKVTATTAPVMAHTLPQTGGMTKSRSSPRQGVPGAASFSRRTTRSARHELHPNPRHPDHLSHRIGQPNLGHRHGLSSAAVCGSPARSGGAPRLVGGLPAVISAVAAEAGRGEGPWCPAGGTCSDSSCVGFDWSVRPARARVPPSARRGRGWPGGGVS